MQETLRAAQRQLPVRINERGWATLNLATALQDLADGGGPGARTNADEARALFRTLRPNDVTAPGTDTPDFEFRAHYDRLAARLRS